MAQAVTKAERRRQLLDAAIEVFGEKGYHDAQISEIIQTAGVARGTFYLYFKGKREIFDCIMEELFERVQAEVRSIPKEALNEIPAQVMGNIERVINLLLDHPMLARLLVNAAVGLDEEQDDRLRKFYGQLLDLIRRGLKQGQEMGFVRGGDYQVLAISLLGSIKEILYQTLLGTEKMERKAIAAEVYRLVLHGVAQPDLLSEAEAALII